MNFDLGAYGIYIWPAYGITALALAAAIFLTWRGWRVAKALLAVLEKGRP